ncbi:MAG: hypothetical protein IPJ89_04950 [Candidatus Iainarchaeum archaeon]|uniref:Uncharacterized protein n=1 Tax=Candidatus Iainarchaeum sp. TaxID=3101447 RepID=A0A7T9I1L6_9ARCH|nr:MAG: hypothetical protein IPJ89_04950 [Candidatus Diapherotrites archaeon]
MVSPKIVPIKLPRGWVKRPHVDELHGIARRIKMQFTARRRELEVHAPNESSPSSIGLVQVLKMNRLRHQQEISAVRVAAKIGFVAAGIRSGVQRHAIRTILFDHHSLVYGFTLQDRRKVTNRMLDAMRRVKGVNPGALRQFMDRFLGALGRLRAGLRN